MHLLLVEDDERLARALTRLLEEDRHVVEHAPDGRTGLELASALDGLDAVILDIGLPDMSGLDVARRLRKDGIDVSILMLTARDTVNDRVTGLDAGADDYVVKPFAYQEVAARLRALARRAEPGPRRAEPKLTAGAIALDEAARRVTVERRQRRPQPARVLAARGAAPPRRPDAHPRPAARPRLAVQRRGDARTPSTPTSTTCARSSAPRAPRSRRSAAWGTASPMADGARIDPRDDDAEQAALAEDAPADPAHPLAPRGVERALDARRAPRPRRRRCTRSSRGTLQEASVDQLDARDRARSPRSSRATAAGPERAARTRAASCSAAATRCSTCSTTPAAPVPLGRPGARSRPTGCPLRGGHRGRAGRRGRRATSGPRPSTIEAPRRRPFRPDPRH